MLGYVSSWKWGLEGSDEGILDGPHVFPCLCPGVVEDEAAEGVWVS